jgi:glycosyltransferase involved in cell wall biosynthesis
MEAFESALDGRGQGGLLVFAGRLVAETGLDLLLQALVETPEARREILGDGLLANCYRDLVTELGLSLRVSFLGSRFFEAVAEAFRRAGVVLVPTPCEEAFGVSPVRAKAIHRPRLVTPSGALPGLCACDRGFAVSDEAPVALAEALRAALADTQERARRAHLGHGFAHKHLTAESVGALCAATYAQVAA